MNVQPPRVKTQERERVRRRIERRSEVSKLTELKNRLQHLAAQQPNPPFPAHPNGRVNAA